MLCYLAMSFTIAELVTLYWCCDSFHFHLNNMITHSYSLHTQYSAFQYLHTCTIDTYKGPMHI